MSGYTDLSAAIRTIKAATFRLSLCRSAQVCARQSRWQGSRGLATAAVQLGDHEQPIDVNKFDHLNPQPLDFSTTPFIDSCSLTVASGAGGHGCVSFLREKYIEHGPPNGGDGGTGGNIYIQAVKNETSLHKIARRRIMKAGRGKNGQGGLQGGKRGDDILIEVPVGTVIREIGRHDPIAEELEQSCQDRRAPAESKRGDVLSNTQDWKKHWVLYPGTLPEGFSAGHIPRPPRARRSTLAMTAPSAPITLDLDRAMASPLLLTAGAMGGMGNPHFVTRAVSRPKYATRGQEGVTIDLQFELKLLADVGLVGLPNAGKSTLLRALTASRARIGNWAFTTLAPNVGTVVLDSCSGPVAQKRQLRDAASGDLRTHFTIADIPGLIEDAHLDKGLGLGFLRHIERARALAFVIDLSAGDAVQALVALWAELHEYEKLREDVVEEDRVTANESYVPSVAHDRPEQLPLLQLPPISSKPWLVVATKADLDETQENFATLREYLAKVEKGDELHPSGKMDAWTRSLRAVPVCAKDKQNTEAVLDYLVELLSRH